MDESGSVDRIRRANLMHGDAMEILRTLPREACDLIVSSPPYNIGKIYERSRLPLEAYLDWKRDIVKLLRDVLKPTGSVCWQTGNYINDGQVFPLDMYMYNIFLSEGFKLRNRIIWRFNFGLNSTRRLSGRYETVLWFSKGDDYHFNVDPIRVPQIYPGKRHSSKKGERAGKPSGNPAGKNPGDFWEFDARREFYEEPVWDFPNVKANHVEKTMHPCQFPVELAERCVLAFAPENGLVLDPFVGTGATVIAAVRHKRRGIGIDKEASYILEARRRLELLNAGELRLRPIGSKVYKPSSTSRVAQVPSEWSQADGTASEQANGSSDR